MTTLRHIRFSGTGVVSAGSGFGLVQSFSHPVPFPAALPAAFREHAPAFRVFAEGFYHFPESFREIAVRSGARPEPVRETIVYRKKG